MHLIIDVGGTNTELVLHPAGLQSRITYRTPKSEQGLYSLIEQIMNKYAPTGDFQSIIGLPGPVSDLANRVYCPPLGFSVSKSGLTKSLKRWGGLIVNDTVALSVALSCQDELLETRRWLLVTIGTSIGCCHIERGIERARFQSYELAHTDISFYIREQWPITNGKYPLRFLKDAFNAKFIVDSFRSLETSTGDRGEILVKLIVHQLLNMSTIFQPVEKLVLWGGLSEYLTDTGRQKMLISEFNRKGRTPDYSIGNLKIMTELKDSAKKLDESIQLDFGTRCWRIDG